MYRAALLAPAIVVLLGGPISFAGVDLAGIVGPAPLTASPTIPPSAPGGAAAAEDLPRSFSDQPPVIPHAIVGYRLDAKANDCLSCHARTRTARAPGPTISLSHFAGRDGKDSASLSPSRYFCTQCHVPQVAVSPPVGNTYRVLATVLVRRHVCMECHLQQVETPSPGGGANLSGSNAPH